MTTAETAQAAIKAAAENGNQESYQDDLYKQACELAWAMTEKARTRRSFLTVYGVLQKTTRLSEIG